MYYVTMVDKGMSGWGKAKNKTNKLAFICETREEAEIVFRNANNRTDMKYINIDTNMPHEQSGEFLQFKTKGDYPNWYVPGYFNY